MEPMNSTDNPTVETYSLKAGNGSGRHVRTATLVRFADGEIVRFMERLPKGVAIRQAIAERERQARS